jgi:hypothetical protein
LLHEGTILDDPDRLDFPGLQLVALPVPDYYSGGWWGQAKKEMRLLHSVSGGRLQGVKQQLSLGLIRISTASQVLPWSKQLVLITMW